MTKFCFSRFVAAALIAISGAALVTASFDAEARRAGGGSSACLLYTSPSPRDS